MVGSVGEQSTNEESLTTEWSVARGSIYRDGYDMSFGELMSLYDKRELIVNPEYQRLFRWSALQKTRFIESVLLNIPIPPIFVFSDDKGRWELVDGLQRLSTILEFTGQLRDGDDKPVRPLILRGTQFLPSLDGVKWAKTIEADAKDSSLPNNLQLFIKRARIRVEILGQQTDLKVKYELFQRLNTGGSNLQEQEVRSCVIYAVSRDLFDFVRTCTALESFKRLTLLTERQLEQQYDRELISRLLVYRNVPYERRLDVAEYIDDGMLQLAQNTKFNFKNEMRIISLTFDKLDEAVVKPFSRRGSSGAFSVSAFEFIVYGLSKRVETGKPISKSMIAKLVGKMGDLPAYKQNAASGVRGTDRLRRLVFEHAVKHFE